MAKTAKTHLNIKNHVLLPKHTKLNDKERDEVFSKYKITFNELPKINLKDAALSQLNVQEGDVIKISRDSPTAGSSVYYRGVINE